MNHAVVETNKNRLLGFTARQYSTKQEEEVSCWQKGSLCKACIERWRGPGSVGGQMLTQNYFLCSKPAILEFIPCCLTK